MIDNGTKSTTIRLYVSAIKHIPTVDGYEWNDKAILLGSLTRACKLVNDTVQHRLPISRSMLEILLFEIKRVFNNQQYLETLYKTMLAIGYYGMFRVGEIASEHNNKHAMNHTVKAAHVHIGKNKDKLMFVLYSSKTHGNESAPQKVKISANHLFIKAATDLTCVSKKIKKFNEHFCPFKLFNEYMKIQGGYENEDEYLFLFRDKTPVTPTQVRQVLKQCIIRVGLNDRLYGFHSLTVGRTTDLINLGYSVEQVKRLGRWKSNAVYKYIKQ